MNRRAWAAAVAIVAGAAGLAVAAPARSDDAEGAALLEASRVAATSYDYVARVEIEWNEGGDVRRVEVRAGREDGALHLADSAGALRYGPDGLHVQTGGRWTEAWGDGAPAGPPLDPGKYDVVVDDDGPVVAGRSTTVVDIRSRADGALVERNVLDDETQLLLARERYSSEGEMLRSVAVREFLSVPTATAQTGRLGAAPEGGVARERFDAPSQIGRGFALVGVYDAGSALQLLYSDGVLSASVFVQEGRLDWDAAQQRGAQRREVAGTRAAVVALPIGWSVSWEGDGRVYTCVTDAEPTELASMMAAFPGPSARSVWGRVADFLLAPFRWE